MYPVVNEECARLKMTIETVDLPSCKIGDVPSLFVNFYQMVSTAIYQDYQWWGYPGEAMMESTIQLVG